jgi:homoserine O-acetyltransferase
MRQEMRQMKITTIFIVTACVISLLSSAGAQDLKFADLGDFKLESGEVIRDCRLGYRTFGQLNRERSNAVLLPTWAGGTSEQLKSSVGKHALLDDSKYFVIAVDALSNGVSSSPSNSISQPRMKFPKITMRDMVNSQHRLLIETMGITHLKAVVGVSMGGMQTFEWMVAYPDFMDKAVPIVGSPRLAPYDLLHWQTEIDAIKNDPSWMNGDYTTNPARRLEFELGALILTTPERYNQKKTREDVIKDLNKAENTPGSDANNKIRQVEAMMSVDVSNDFGHSMDRAAASVKARVLIVVSRYDHVVTPQPALDFAAQLHAQVIELDSDCGHSVAECDNARINGAVAEFLDK